eukprot:10771359-Karenia_brevis.AAC.1
MAEEGHAAIGGWLRHESGRRELETGLHYEFTEEKEHWIFDKGAANFFAKIATLELLGTLVGAEALARSVELAHLQIGAYAATDNKGNMHI